MVEFQCQGKIMRNEMLHGSQKRQNIQTYIPIACSSPFYRFYVSWCRAWIFSCFSFPFLSFAKRIAKNRLDITKRKKEWRIHAIVLFFVFILIPIRFFYFFAASSLSNGRNRIWIYAVCSWANAMRQTRCGNE